MSKKDAFKEHRYMLRKLPLVKYQLTTEEYKHLRSKILAI